MAACEPIGGLYYRCDGRRSCKWSSKDCEKAPRELNNAMGSRHFRMASWLHAQCPEFTPAKLDEWICGDNLFEELIFRQGHYGDIFTSGFLQRLRDPDPREFCFANGEVVSWVKEKYLGT